MAKQNQTNEYMVWGPDAPKVKHRSFSIAVKEAHRLARKNPETEFSVVRVEKTITFHPNKSTSQAANKTSQTVESPLAGFRRRQV